MHDLPTKKHGKIIDAICNDFHFHSGVPGGPPELASQKDEQYQGR